MADFDFCDMVIDRMAAHTIFARQVGNVKKDPLCYDELIVLDSDSSDVLHNLFEPRTICVPNLNGGRQSRANFLVLCSIRIL